MTQQKTFLKSQDGVAAVEFALVAPFLLVMLIGVICYGGYFWLSHSVQQAANDAARAAVAGLDATERAGLARASVADGVPSYVILEPGRVSTEVREDAERMVVTIRYDAAGSAFWLFGDLVPMPSRTVRATAVVRMGGY